MEIKTYIDQIWRTYDQDDSGSIDYEEAYTLITDTLKNLMVEMQVNKEDFTRFFQEIDEDGSGLIDKSEIAMFLINMKRL